MFKSFSVTQEFDKRGYNGKMFTEQVIDHMKDIIKYNDASTSQGNGYRQLGTTFLESDISIVEEGGALKSNPLSIFTLILILNIDYQ